MLRRAAGRPGFTFIELVVSLAVLGLLAAVLLPQTVGRLSRGETAALANNLQSITGSIQRFRDDVGRYPDSLTHLAALASGRRDLCGRIISAADHARWSGPYLNRQLPAAGLPSGTSVISAKLTRDPATITGGITAANMTVTVRGVDLEVANEMEAAFDGNANPAEGTVRWAADEGPSRGTLRYVLPISGC